MNRPMIPLLLALLTVPTCASLPQFAAADGTFVVGAELPAFPTWAPTKRGPVRVVLVRNLTCNNAPAHGCYIYSSRDILIEESLPLVLRWRILRHELAHAAFDANGLKFGKDSLEQAAADAMADQQIAEMISGWPR